MKRSELYIAEQFVRYFPESDVVVHADNDAETITVTVRDTPLSDPDLIFSMQVGSDDDYFIFENNQNGSIITVPFAEWM